MSGGGLAPVPMALQNQNHRVRTGARKGGERRARLGSKSAPEAAAPAAAPPRPLGSPPWGPATSASEAPCTRTPEGETTGQVAASQRRSQPRASERGRGVCGGIRAAPARTRRACAPASRRTRGSPLRTDGQRRIGDEGGGWARKKAHNTGRSAGICREARAREGGAGFFHRARRLLLARVPAPRTLSTRSGGPAAPPQPA